eukprot:6487268-Amphidinium_carterae.1
MTTHTSHLTSPCGHRAHARDLTTPPHRYCFKQKIHKLLTLQFDELSCPNKWIGHSQRRQGAKAITTTRATALKCQA